MKTSPPDPNLIGTPEELAVAWSRLSPADRRMSMARLAPAIAHLVMEQRQRATLAEPPAPEGAEAPRPDPEIAHEID